MANDSIGPYAFLGLYGAPVWPLEQTAVIQRVGVDGSAFLYTGRRSRPFQLESIVDAANMEQAAAGILAYQTLPGSGPVALVQGGVAWSEADLWVVVLDVQARAIKAALVDGGINPPSLAILEATWTLLGIEYEAPGGS